MQRKNNYTNLQKYIFTYFKNLGYYFFSKQEILVIPKKINLDAEASKFTLYNTNHLFTKEELCLILEKYFCCDYILSIAPLTKYLHLNFIFLKSKDENYYKIKINYVFATPKIQKTKQTSIFYVFNTLSTEKHKNLRDSNLGRVFGFKKGIVLKATTIKNTKKNKFLHLIKQTKFQRTHQFFNFLKKTAVNFNFWCTHIHKKYNYPQSIKSAITHYGLTDLNRQNSQKIIENFEYLETTGFYFAFQAVKTLKILTLNLFEIIKINNDFDLFYFLFYNYCILQNIYMNSDKQLVLMCQNNKNARDLKTALAKYHVSIIGNSTLLAAIPIEEITLGDINWFFDNLNTITKELCELLPFYLEYNEIFSKYSKILYQDKLKNLKSYIYACKLPTKNQILTKKEYFENPVYNWITCFSIYILKSTNAHVALPKIYEEMHFFDINLEQFLKYTNIYSENLSYKQIDCELPKFIETEEYNWMQQII